MFQHASGCQGAAYKNMKSIRIGKYFLVIVSMFWATPQALADTLEFANGQTMQTEHINPAETANNLDTELLKSTTLPQLLQN